MHGADDPALLPEEIAGALERASVLAEDQPGEALDVLRSLIERLEVGGDRLRPWLAEALWDEATVLARLRGDRAALSVMQRVADEFGDVVGPVRPWVVRLALLNAARHALRVGDDRRAREDALRFLGSDGETSPRTEIEALWVLSRACAAQGRADEEVAALQRLLATASETDDERVAGRVATAMLLLGTHLRERGDLAGAVDLWEDLYLKYRARPPRGSLALPAAAVYNEIEGLARAGDPARAVGLVARLVELMAESEAEPDVRLQIGDMAAAAGDVLFRVGAFAEAGGVYAEVWNTLSDSADPRQRGLAVRALLDRGLALARQGRPLSAVEINERVHELGDDSLLGLDLIVAADERHHWLSPERGAWALLMKSTVLLDLGRDSEAQAALRLLVTNYSESPEPLIRPLVQTAQELLQRVEP